MKEEPTNKGSVLVPLLVGGVVGAGIALLLAPKTGKEVRGQIKDLASGTKDTIVTSFNKGKELYAESRTAVMTAIDAGKAAYIEERDKRLKTA